MSLVALLASLLCGSSDLSWFAGGQIVSGGTMLVAGTSLGRWDLWGGASGSFRSYEISVGSRLPDDDGVYGWWGATFWTGATWSSRDSGVSQIVGVQCSVLGVDRDGPAWPTESSQLDLLWGIRWSGGGFRADASVGPSLEWSSNEYFAWFVDVAPVFRVGIAKLW